ncbi:hypothetical protein H9X75_10470, partial [Fusobacterium mortiferum]|uniref:hypothetical protein n=1 Tax=Fusobacterium mortiferum TaxID=850 RepID=UPI001956D99A|nr:hypothetical protein [Fusobacterium mortiferum]
GLDDVQVHLVDSVPAAQQFLAWLSDRRPILAVDVESTGLNWWTPDFTRLVQFGDGRNAYAIPVREWRGVIEQALRQYQG